jgi:nitrite reductase (NO-forming)
MLTVTGNENKEIFSGKQTDNLYYGSEMDKKLENNNSGAGKTDINPQNAKSSEGNSNSIDDIIAAGKKVFMTTCFACHQPDGKGVPNVFPPLAQSNFLNADKQRAIGIVLRGKNGVITVNGKQFNNIMPAQSLSDDQIAAVLTYVYHSFGNSDKTVTKDEVAKVRNGK